MAMSNADREVVKAAAEIIKAATAAGEKVILRGFGTFQMKTRKARVARNPQTGGTVNVPEKIVLAFKASK